MSILSFYYELEAERMSNELKSQVREALCTGAARMHLRSRGEGEDEETIDDMVRDLLAAIEANKYKLPDWPTLALDPFNALDAEETNRQFRKYLASICVIFEDLGYGPYIASEQAVGENSQIVD